MTIAIGVAINHKRVIIGARFPTITQIKQKITQAITNLAVSLVPIPVMA